MLKGPHVQAYCYNIISIPFISRKESNQNENLLFWLIEWSEWFLSAARSIKDFQSLHAAVVGYD